MNEKLPALTIIEQMFTSSNGVPVTRIALTRELWERLKEETKLKHAEIRK